MPQPQLVRISSHRPPKPQSETLDHILTAQNAYIGTDYHGAITASAILGAPSRGQSRYQESLDHSADARQRGLPVPGDVQDLHLVFDQPSGELGRRLDPAPGRVADP